MFVSVFTVCVHSAFPFLLCVRLRVLIVTWLLSAAPSKTARGKQNTSDQPRPTNVINITGIGQLLFRDGPDVSAVVIFLSVPRTASPRRLCKKATYTRDGGRREINSKFLDSNLTHGVGRPICPRVPTLCAFFCLHPSVRSGG